jgi:hypothetical protein
MHAICICKEERQIREEERDENETDKTRRTKEEQSKGNRAGVKEELYRHYEIYETRRN